MKSGKIRTKMYVGELIYKGSKEADTIASDVYLKGSIKTGKIIHKFLLNLVLIHILDILASVKIKNNQLFNEI
jgi:hypothetical protein